MLRLTMLAFTALALTACASASVDSGGSAQQRVYAAKADYLVVQSAAVAYNNLKRCPAPAPCSSPQIVETLRKGNAAAVATLDAAEDTVRTPGVTSSAMNFAIVAALNAVNAVREIIATFAK